jgi:peptide deformylase
MARPARREEEQEGMLSPPKEREAVKRVKITALKVFTRHGRFIAGQWAELPQSEAEDLISKGSAVAA